MTRKIAALGAVVLAGSALVILAGPALVSSTSPAEKGAQANVAVDATVAKLNVRGMTCGACATTARIALERIDGIHDAEVSAEAGSATVSYDPAATRPAQFIPVFERATGYEATVFDDGAASGAIDAAAAPATATPAQASGDR